MPPLLAEALALPSKTPKDKRAAVLIAALMVSNAALLHHRLRVVDTFWTCQVYKIVWIAVTIHFCEQ